MKKRFASILLLGVAGVSPCFAEVITVTDCSGSPLAISSIGRQETREVAVTFAGSDAAARITAKLSAGASSFSKNAENRRAVFQEIGSGSWKLCTEPEDAAIEKVSIQTSTKAGLGVIAAAAGAGGAALAFSGSGSNDSDNAGRIVAAEAEEDAPAAEKADQTATGPAEEVGRPRVPHPCLEAARVGDRDLCGVNGPQPTPTKFISPSF